MGWESRTENPFSLHNDFIGMVALCVIFPPLSLYLGGRTFLVFLSAAALAAVVVGGVAGWYSTEIAAIGWAMIGISATFALGKQHGFGGYSARPIR